SLDCYSYIYKQVQRAPQCRPVRRDAHLHKTLYKLRTFRIMKTLFTTFAILFLAFTARAQGSLNIVGYYNLSIQPGYNLIANQLSYSNNTLNAIFNSTTPIGSTFTRWDPVAQQFAPVSLYTGSGWTINYGLNFGEGGILTSPIAWTNTFVGEVTHDFNVDTGV